MRLAALLAAVALLAGCSSGSPGGAASPSVASSSAPSPATSAPGSGTPSASGGGSPGATVSPLPPKSGTPKLDHVGGAFKQVTHVAAPPGDPRLFVVEQGGTIRIVRDGKQLPAPFLDLSAQTRNEGEQGLLSMAFAPDFATSGLFYVDHNARDGDLRIAEYHVSADPDRADPGSRRELLRIGKPETTHNGGQLWFDRAGMLLASVGDGGGSNDPGNDAQNLGNLLGKIIRLDPKPAGGKAYGIPRDNPFVGRSGARAEIWAYGLRNPWRFSLDAQTGDLYVGDVGQYAIEELDAVPAARAAGANFGWRVWEGRRRNFPGETPNAAGPLVEPVHQFNHDGGRCVITAGVVYRGSVTALRGKFLFGEFCTGTLWSIPAGTATNPRLSTLPFTVPTMTTFGVDGYGEVYVGTASGNVYRISA